MRNRLTRIIRIESCEECPYIDHRGAFGKVAYIPCCDLEEGRELPYTTSVDGNRIIATPTGVIPDWCPLEKEETRVADKSIAYKMAAAERDALLPVFKAAKGLCFGTDWNKGAHALKYGYRQKLIDAVRQARNVVEDE